MEQNHAFSVLNEIFERLLKKYGNQYWWPADEPFEVIIGAILTQSASWKNVEKAINKLKEAGMIDAYSIRNINRAKLADIIHSCGYYNAKAEKLKIFAEWFKNRFNDSLESMFTEDTKQLRQELLEIKGIGEETADSILLYAVKKPVFVIDAYTRRIIDRIGLKPHGTGYRDYQELFMINLPSDVQIFNEYHALLVNHGKIACKKAPACAECCLADICKTASSK